MGRPPEARPGGKMEGLDQWAGVNGEVNSGLMMQVGAGPYSMGRGRAYISGD